jgi:uncharacterized membrane protein HdeD (DUF308 family)
MTISKNNSVSLKYWWFPLLFGVLFLLIGIWILRAPAESLSTLTKIVGVIAIVSGTVQLVFTLGNRRGDTRVLDFSSPGDWWT